MHMGPHKVNPVHCQQIRNVAQCYSYAVNTKFKLPLLSRLAKPKFHYADLVADLSRTLSQVRNHFDMSKSSVSATFTETSP